MICKSRSRDNKQIAILDYLKIRHPVFVVFYLMTLVCHYSIANDQIIPQNEIWYTTSDNSVVRPKAKAFSQQILSNTYNDGKGIIVFDKPITIIGASAFNGCDKIQSIIIPNGVTSIQRSAFLDCVSLKSITLPESLETVSVLAFSHCKKLEDIVLPSKCSNLGLAAFEHCESLRTIIIPNEAKIGASCFSYCYNLENISFPPSLKSIEESAFYMCENLTEITFPIGFKKITSGAFAGCKRLSVFHSDFATPDGRCIIVNKKIISFAPANIVEYSISDEVNEIGANVFKDCSFIKAIILSDSVKKIDENAFANCYSLEKIKIPESTQSIRDGAFSNCLSLKKISIPGSIVSIGKGVFENCKRLEYFEGPFASPDGKGLIMDSILISIAPYNLSSFSVPNNVRIIESSAFENCHLLTKVSVSSPVFSIRNKAFANCTSLKSIDFPSSLSYIGYDAFLNDESLTEITIRSLFPPELANVREFDYIQYIFVPKEVYGVYKSHKNWGVYFDKIKINK